MALIVPVLALSLPRGADAQTVITTHPVKAKLKLLYQDTGNNDQPKIGKLNLNERDVFEICTGEAPTRTQGIFLSIDCENPSNNRIVAADTDPVSVIEVLGDLNFDEDFSFETESNNGSASVVSTTELEINCELLELQIRGVANSKFKPLGDAGGCLDSSTLSLSGPAEFFVENFIVDTGSKVTVGRRSSTIEIPLEDPNDL